MIDAEKKLKVICVFPPFNITTFLHKYCKIVYFSMYSMVLSLLLLLFSKMNFSPYKIHFSSIGTLTYTSALKMLSFK